MIKIENFTKKYSKTKTAAQNISIECGKGITGLIGLNGAGKSTVLKAASSLHFATEGKVSVSDSEGNFFDCSENPGLAKKNTGFVPETSFLPKRLSVREFLKDSLDLYEIPESMKPEYYREALGLCFLSEVENQKIGTLSKGFVQRLLLASALVRRPENLILDEAASGLDPSQIIQFRKTVKDYSENHCVLISTHIMQEVSALCDRIYVIKEGKIIAEGSEEELVAESRSRNLEEAFLKLNGIESFKADF